MGKIVSRSFSGAAGYGEWALSVGIAHTRTIGARATCPYPCTRQTRAPLDAWANSLHGADPGAT